MKRGFTLIELLGVIVILSVIVVIVMPNVINTIKKTNRQSDIYISNMIYSALDKYMNDYNVFEEKDNNTYCININELTSNGYLNSPIKYNENENIENTMSVKATYNKKWNYSIVKNNECTSNVEYICNRVVTATLGFVPRGNYEIGDEYTCKINSNNTLNFIILGTTGNKVKLISSSNLTDNSKWYNTLTNINGPIDAYNFISTNTSTWSNIPAINNFSFIDTINNCASCGYNGIYIRKNLNDYIATITSKSGDTYTLTNLKARLPMYSELTSIGCTTTNNSCPEWVGSNFYLNDSVIGTNNSAYYISLNHSIASTQVNTDAGIRIVIELYKFNLE